MDSLTHIVLGATIGEVMGGKKLGKAALLLGAAAQSVPDIDFVAFLWTTPSEDLLAHRGFTHSFLFAVLVSISFALAAKRWLPDRALSLSQWTTFFGLQVVVHDFIDAFNAYGTGWFEPFSHVRISFHSLFVADPFFSITPAVVAVVLLFLKTGNMHRLKWAWTGILGCALYLGYAVSNKLSVVEDVKVGLAADHITYKRLLTTPTPLNTWLWWIVAEQDSGFYVGFRSLLDKEVKTELKYFPRNELLLDPVHDHEDLQHLKRFSQGYYTAESRGDTLVFNDLRFGQNGWANPEAPFVFNFYLSHPADNDLVIQRGRFAHWNRQTLNSFIQRIEGR